MPFAALYDACVLIPHEVRDILTISASTRQHAVYWSDDIFAEWIRNAVDKGLASQESALRFQAIMNTMFPDAMIASARYERLIDSMTNDKKDRHVLAAAVVAEADVVVTSNVGDFPKPSVEPYRIQTQTPDEFVRTQAALNPLLFRDGFLRRAQERNRLAQAIGKGPLLPEDIAMFLGPSNMPEKGQYLTNCWNFSS
jgi:hypothetical protein